MAAPPAGPATGPLPVEDGALARGDGPLVDGRLHPEAVVRGLADHGLHHRGAVADADTDPLSRCAT